MAAEEGRDSPNPPLRTDHGVETSTQPKAGNVGGEKGGGGEEEEKKSDSGLPSSGRHYRDVPVPSWFRDASASAFRSMTVESTDVVVSSGVKMGTTWVHKILHSLMHLYRDDGTASTDATCTIGSNNQVYPEAMPLDQAERAKALADGSSDPFLRARAHFGDYTFEDLVNQPEPRLFSTHLFGTKLLPAELLGTESEPGKGRLIVVLRNLKDVLSSLHYFLGEAKDDWMGNEHGVGSFRRFLNVENCPNAFGNAFRWVDAMDEVVQLLQRQAALSETKERVLVVYYEALKADLPAQLDRINAFLDRPPLTNAKRMAVAEACGFASMKAGGSTGLRSAIMRKGCVGDWRNHLDRASWEAFDQVFDRILGRTVIAEPLRHFQWWEVPGMPPVPRREWTLDTDPRTWPLFERVTLREGMVVPDRLIARAGAAVGDSGAKQGFVRPPSEFCGVIPSEEHPVEAGRYHIFVSGICPWAMSVATARYVLGLEDVVSMDVADGQSGAGWAFLDGASVSPWKGRPGPFWLHEAYQLHDSRVTTRITVPVLWDTKTNTIVSNDSWAIVKMLSTAFAGMGKPPSAAASILTVEQSGQHTLMPTELADEMEDLHTEIYKNLLNGVYRAGLGLMRNGEEENSVVLSARQDVYNKLAELNERLSQQRFLLGEKLVAVDIRLAMTLLRYDCAYRDSFVLQGGRGGILVGDGYPNLKKFIKNVCSAILPVVDFRAIRQYYRIRQSVQQAYRSTHPDHGQLENAYESLPPIPDLREIISVLGVEMSDESRSTR